MYVFKLTDGRGKATLLSCSDFFVSEDAKKTCSVPFEKTILTSTPSIADLIAEHLYDRESFSIAEVLYIFRPLMSMVLLWRFGKKSWLPWTLPLAMEAISYHLKEIQRQKRTDDGHHNHHIGQGVLDLVERNRRFMFLYLYLIREPLFASYIR